MAFHPEDTMSHKIIQLSCNFKLLYIIFNSTYYNIKVIQIMIQLQQLISQIVLAFRVNLSPQ